MSKEYEYTRMTVGKHKGKFLKEVPDDYLAWAIDNWQDQGIVLMFRAEAARRKLNKKLKAKITV